jgi:putative cell wall-binding protein/biotin carboxyl carrier protein
VAALTPAAGAADTQSVSAKAETTTAGLQTQDQHISALQGESAELRRELESNRTFAAKTAERSAGSFVRPIAGAVTSPFGYRGGGMHTGIDMDGVSGEPILASAGGTVISAVPRGGYGKTTVIDHGGGVTTLYSHQLGIEVNPGDTVSAGQVIGWVGSTGFSTGSHLHYEIRINGQPVNPADWFGPAEPTQELAADSGTESASGKAAARQVQESTSRSSRRDVTLPKAQTSEDQTATAGLKRTATEADPVGAAVEVSQLAFDDGGASHAVVTRNDKFADTLAGGPLAGSEGPVLLTDSGELDRRVRDELDRVLSKGKTVYILGGENAISAEVERALAQRWQVRRLAGPDRTATAARVAEEVRPDGSEWAMVARAYPDGQASWADALAGGAFGAAADVPVLLTSPGELDRPTRNGLDQLGATKTVVLGGPAAVSPAVTGDLPRPQRVAGSDRAGTAAAAAKELWRRDEAESGHEFTVASGYSGKAWTRALVAAPLAARQNAPLLLVDDAKVPANTAGYLDALGYGGGTQAGGWAVAKPARLSGDVLANLNDSLR